MNEPLHATLSDAARLLQSENLRFALIGGLAASLRGQPRVTSDVDFVVAAELDQIISLARRLDVTKFRGLFADVEQVVETSFILPLRHRESNVKVDIAVGLSGFERQTVGRATPVEIAECQIPVASAEDLLLMKLLAGRPKDLQDIEGLIIAQENRLDWNYCYQVAAELGEAIDQDLVGPLQAFRAKIDAE